MSGDGKDTPDRPEEAALARTEPPQPASEPGVGAITETPQNEAPLPQLPPRDYSHDPRLLQYVPPVAPLPRDRTLVRFFRFMASLLFWGGSAAGLAVLFFRSVVLPRLAILSSRLTALHAHHLLEYGKFAESIRKAAISNSTLCPKTSASATAVQTPLPCDETKDEAVQVGPGAADETVNLLDAPIQTSSRPVSRTSQASEKAVVDQTEGSTTTAPEVDITASLRASLASLKVQVEASTRSVEEEQASAPKKLIDSLETLSSYISTQSFYATQMKLNLGGGGYSFGQVPAPTGAPIQSSPAGEAAAQCRSEIRGLKGLLLNRRNFALLDRDWGDDEMPTIA